MDNRTTDTRRLTEWIDNTHARAHLDPNVDNIGLYDVYNRLAEYEDIGTVTEFEKCKGIVDRLKEYYDRLDIAHNGKKDT